SNCPYHYEYGNEEWLLVLSGTLTVRHPDGETELGSGDLASFLEGPAGAHKLTNKGAEPVRFVMMSTKIDPSMGVYPDSDKIAGWPRPGEQKDRIMVRRESNVDYWDRET
ncbi:MAG: cupin domain-containing protein, partial [Gaiellaceae bacterium]